MLYALIYFGVYVYFTLSEGPIYPKTDLKSLETSILIPIIFISYIVVFYINILVLTAKVWLVNTCSKNGRQNQAEKQKINRKAPSSIDKV